MSEHVGLGESDADARWIGVRRHQAGLIVVGLGLATQWLVSSSPFVVALIAVVLLVCALPAYDGLTLGEALVVALRYVTRSHWGGVSVLTLGHDVALWANGDVSFRAYELNHRGRLDLTGRDVILARNLVALADAASAARTSQHFSQHVLRNAATTMLALPLEVPAPEGWSLHTELALETVGVGGATSLEYFERWSYLRVSKELYRLYRVHDFSAVSVSRGLLEQLLRSPSPCDLALHVEVVSGARAQRLASRAVHRVGSDDATSRAAGFRRTARSGRAIERLAQREILVAQGRSLLRVGVFLKVSASSLDELQRRSAALWRHAHDGGLRLERGWGLQAQWFRAQLPGGPGW